MIGPHSTLMYHNERLIIEKELCSSVLYGYNNVINSFLLNKSALVWLKKDFLTYRNIWIFIYKLSIRKKCFLLLFFLLNVNVGFLWFISFNILTYTTNFFRNITCRITYFSFMMSKKIYRFIWFRGNTTKCRFNLHSTLMSWR